MCSVFWERLESSIYCVAALVCGRSWRWQHRWHRDYHGFDNEEHHDDHDHDHDDIENGHDGDYCVVGDLGALDNDERFRVW